MHFECTRTLTGPCGTLSSPTAYQSIKNDFSQRFISLPFLRDVLIFGFMSKSSTEFIKPFSPPDFSRETNIFSIFAPTSHTGSWLSETLHSEVCRIHVCLHDAWRGMKTGRARTCVNLIIFYDVLSVECICWFSWYNDSQELFISWAEVWTTRCEWKFR